MPIQELDHRDTVVSPSPAPGKPRNSVSACVRSLVLAILLPLLCADLTGHISFFHQLPYALNFLVVTVLATLDGLGLASLAVCSAVIGHFLFYNRGGPPPHFSLIERLRALVMISTVIGISLVQRARRLTQSRHTAALEILEERTTALIETLHASKCASWRLDLNSSHSPLWYGGSYPVFGRPFPEIEALPSLVPLLHPDDQPRLEEVYQQMRHTHDLIVFEHRVPWPNGEMHWLEKRATRVPGPGLVWRGITTDITDRKRTEASLLRSEKLAAMGRLASTVAHEINNPLESVTNLLFLAHTDPSLTHETRTYLTTAEQELARLGEITRLTLGFVRTSGTRRSLQPAEVVNDVLSIFRHRLERKKIQVQTHLDPDARIFIAAHELRQVLTNLISNAADALPASPDRHDAFIRVTVAADPTHTTLILEDNGSGIPYTILPRIFDPFFTTKLDVGTGIGLWVTRELIESNHGQITAESGDLGDGVRTRFRLTFPHTQPGPDAATLATTPSELPQPVPSA